METNTLSSATVLPLQGLVLDVSIIVYCIKLRFYGFSGQGRGYGRSTSLSNKYVTNYSGLYFRINLDVFCSKCFDTDFSERI